MKPLFWFWRLKLSPIRTNMRSIFKIYLLTIIVNVHADLLVSFFKLPFVTVYFCTTEFILYSYIASYHHGYILAKHAIFCNTYADELIHMEECWDSARWCPAAGAPMSWPNMWMSGKRHLRLSSAFPWAYTSKGSRINFKNIRVFLQKLKIYHDFKGCHVTAHGFSCKGWHVPCRESEGLFEKQFAQTPPTVFAAPLFFFLTSPSLPFFKIQKMHL